MRSAALAGLIAFVAFWSTLQAPVSGDATTHVYLADSFLRDGDADLVEFAAAPEPLVFNSISFAGHVYSPYVPGNAALFVPFALLAAVAGLPAESLAVAGGLAKLAASAIEAFAVACVYAALRQVTAPRAAAFLTFAYALGTMALSVASQLFWQHAPTQALVALALLLLLRQDGARAGLPLGFALLVRPQTGIVVLALAAFVAHRRRAALPRFVAWGVATLPFLAVYDAALFGSPFQLPASQVPLVADLTGVAGLLVSPSRGLLVYSPFLLAALVALAASWRWWPTDDRVWLMRYGALAFVASLLFFGAYTDWEGGWTFGNRYLTDILPIYLLALGMAWERGLFARALARRLFAAAVGWSVLLQAAGAGLYYFYWNGFHWDASPPGDQLASRVWSWGDTQWAWVLRRLVNDPGPAIFLEAAILCACGVAFARLGRAGEGR